MSDAAPPVTPSNVKDVQTPGRWLWWLVLVGLGLLAYGNTWANPLAFGLVRPQWAWPTATATLELAAQLGFEADSGEGNATLLRGLGLVVHALTGLTLLGLVKRTLFLPGLRPRLGRHAEAYAFVVAAFWLLHPLHTQLINTAAYRGPAWVTLCYLFTLYGAVRHWQANTLGMKRVWLWAAALSCWAGMLSGSVMVTAPLAVFLYDTTFLRGSWPAMWRKRRWLYVMLPMGWVALAWASPECPEQDVSGWHYLLTQFGAVMHYLRLAVLPYPLMVLYDWPLSAGPELSGAAWWGAFMRDVLVEMLVLLGLLLVSLWGVMHRRWWGFVGTLFFLTLMPTSSVWTQEVLIAEPRMSLPLVWLSVLLVFGVHVLLGLKVFRPLPGMRRLGTVLVAGLAVGLLSAYGTLTWSRNEDYRDAETLWTTTIVHDSDHAEAYYRRGLAREAAGEAGGAWADYQRASLLQPGNAVYQSAVSGGAD